MSSPYFSEYAFQSVLSDLRILEGKVKDGEDFDRASMTIDSLLHDLRCMRSQDPQRAVLVERCRALCSTMAAALRTLMDECTRHHAWVEDAIVELLFTDDDDNEDEDEEEEAEEEEKEGEEARDDDGAGTQGAVAAVEGL